MVRVQAPNPNGFPPPSVLPHLLLAQQGRRLQRRQQPTELDLVQVGEDERGAERVALPEEGDIGGQLTAVVRACFGAVGLW